MKQKKRFVFRTLLLKLFIGTGIVLMFSVPTRAQDFLYECKRILINSAQTGNEINGIAEDRYGMIWLGSDHGLFRFDGYTTDRIVLPRSSLSSIPTRINSIAFFEGKVFLATAQGVFALNSFNHQLHRISDDSNPVNVVHADEASGVWWVDKQGELYNFQHNKKRSVALPVLDPSATPMLCSDKDHVWVAFRNVKGNQIFEVEKDGLRIQEINTGIINGKLLWNLRVNDSGAVCLLLPPKSYVWNPVLKQMNEFTGFGNDVFDLLQCEHGSFVVKDENRIVHHYLKNGVKHEFNIDLGAVKPERIYTLYYLNHCIYAATTNGMLIIKVQRNLFENIFGTYDHLSKAFLVPRGIAEDSNYIYLATYEKLISYDRLRHSTKIIQEHSLNTRSILIDHDTLWMATEGAGLKKFILSFGRMLPTRTQNEFSKNFMFCIARLDARHLLIGGLKHLMLYDTYNDSFDEISVVFNGMDVCESRVNQIISVGPDKWWIATGKGVYCIDAQGKILHNYASTLKNENEQNTFAILINDDESVWAGTANGMLLINKNGIVKKRITGSEGLAGNRVISLVRDRKQDIWAATFTGLSCFNPAKATIKNFYKEHGLPDDEFNHSSFCLLESGHIVLGSVNGFVEFNPDDLSEIRKQALGLVISKVEYGNLEYKMTDLTRERCNQSPVRLGKDIQYIKLFFTTIPTPAFLKLTYEYKIDGIHPDWVSLGNSPFLHLDNFKPGSYELTVRAVGGSGNEQIATITLPLEVEQYFYTSTVFYIIVFAIIFFLLFMYLVALLMRNRKISDIRQSIARDLHDEIGGYLTGISMNVELMLKNRTKEKQYAETITTLGQKALRSLKDSLWSLDIRSDNARQLWDRVKELTSDLYESLDIDFRFEQPEGLEKIRLRPVEKNYLLFIIKECLHNSIRYGDRKIINLSWRKAASGHQIVISNTEVEGAGMKGSGKGVYNIQNRMNKIKGRAEFESTHGIFTVKLFLDFI